MLAYYQDTEDIGTKPHLSLSVSVSVCVFWKCWCDGEWARVPLTAAHGVCMLVGDR